MEDDNIGDINMIASLPNLARHKNVSGINVSGTVLLHNIQRKGYTERSKTCFCPVRFFH